MRHILLFILAVAGLAGEARAQAFPGRIGFQGRLTDGAGNPVNAPTSLTFRLYTVETGGAEVWSESMADVPVSGGLYSVLLGGAGWGAADFGVPYWLGVQVGSDDEMVPRYPLAASPYAIRAKGADDAERLGGQLASAFVPALGSTAYVAKAGDTMTGTLDVALGALTADVPAWNAAATWNNGAIPFTLLKADVTDTASDAGSLLLDLRVGGSSRFSVSKSGVTRIAADTFVTGCVAPGADCTYTLGNPVLRWDRLYLAPGSLHLLSRKGETSPGAPARDWALSINAAGGLSIRQAGAEVVAVRDGAAEALEVKGGARISGALVRGCDTVCIDHPLDPENTYLCHASVEALERATVHGGNVVLDGNGAAWVALPDWFEALNGEVRYQLTPVGAPAPDLHVAGEVAGNRFKIAGGRPGLKVSWQVTGIRRESDGCSPLRVEEPKPPSERGRRLTDGQGPGRS